MSAKFDTEFGVVSVEEDVIARVAGMAALECYGVVGMASINMTDGIVKLLTREQNLTQGVRVSVSDKMVIELHIIAQYGANIRAISDGLIERVKYDVKSMLNLDVEEVKVFVEGLQFDKTEEKD